MKIIAPDYYNEFTCIADKCKHTCCQGWEVDIDEDSLERFNDIPDICEKIEFEETPHFKLLDEERCPFLNEDNLCNMILTHGEDILCQICTDHPRYRNYWEDRTEIGLGLVCEEAGRLILGRDTPMELVELSDDGSFIEQPEDEEWLMDIRSQLIDRIQEDGPKARLLEYLYFRHIPDALYDDRLEARIRFVQSSYDEIMAEWEKTDKTLDSLIECARAWSYDVEYDDEEKEKRISKLDY